eukprot:Nk52_evm48s1444 gene=Nk52_evmTU48s1444
MSGSGKGREPCLRVVVTADDMGYSVSRNRGIVEAWLRGGVSGCSLMVNGAAVEDAIERVKLDKKKKRGSDGSVDTEKTIPCGLHLNLTEFRPVSGPIGEEYEQGLGQFVGNNGYFLGKFGFRQALMSQREGESSKGAVYESLLREIRAQLDKFKALLGHYPAHVDGHQHVHVIPIVARAISEVIHSEPYYHSHPVVIRLPKDEALGEIPWEILPSTRRDFYDEIERQGRESMGVYLPETSSCHPSVICFTSHFIGLSLMGADCSKERLNWHLARITRHLGSAQVDCSTSMIRRTKEGVLEGTDRCKEKTDKEMKAVKKKMHKLMSSGMDEEDLD